MSWRVHSSTSVRKGDGITRPGSWVGLVRREVAIGKTVDFEEEAVRVLAYTVFQINRVHRVDVPPRISLIVHFARLAAICSFESEYAFPEIVLCQCYDRLKVS